MPLILPGNVASATASTTYDVANSCRFDDDDNAYLSRTLGSNGNQKTFTWSAWIKRGNMGASQFLFDVHASGSHHSHIYISSGNAVGVYNANGNHSFSTNNLLRDNSAWYHLVWRVDTTQGSNSDRVRIYINGTEASYASYATIAQDTNFEVNGNGSACSIGRRSAGDYFDGYMAEIFFCDGQSYAPTVFGEYDSDTPSIWKPKDCKADLTFGTHGYYFPFDDSSDLGDDESGEGNDFAENNIAAADQSTDTPTNNFATWNPLVVSNGSTSQGNVKYATSNSSSNYGYRLSTIGVSSGMWYAEVKYSSSSNQALIGIRSREATAVAHYLGYYDDDYAIYTDGHYYNNNSETTNSNASWTNGDIIGIFLDLDNNKLYFSKNGSLYSSTGISITAAASTETGFYFFSVSEWNSSGNGTFELNTGGSPSFSLSSAVDDGDYGSFEYTTTITGDGASKTFKALCTKNLAEFG